VLDRHRTPRRAITVGFDAVDAEEEAMRDMPTVTFRVIMDAFAVALLVATLDGCSSTPTKYRDRTGDFISNLASTEDRGHASSGTLSGSVLLGTDGSGVGSLARIRSTNSVNQLTSTNV
jgi:hypothetical protein